MMALENLMLLWVQVAGGGPGGPGGPDGPMPMIGMAPAPEFGPPSRWGTAGDCAMFEC